MCIRDRLGVYVLSKVFDGIEGDITKQVVLKSLIIAVGYGLILLCSGISNYIRNVYLVQGANEIYVRIQMQVYDHIQSLPILSLIHIYLLRASLLISVFN